MKKGREKEREVVKDGREGEEGERERGREVWREGVREGGMVVLRDGENEQV